MSKTSKFVARVGAVKVSVELYENDESRLHDYGLTPATWRRAAKFLKVLGGDKALDLMDERAERALVRGDFDTCERWRNLMAAIHAIEEGTPLASDRVH